MEKTHTISFDTQHNPVQLEDGASLSENLTISNSPVLFGCRTGICGTCLIEVLSSENLPSPAEDEMELLSVLAPGNLRARLACQIIVSGTMKVRYLGSL